MATKQKLVASATRRSATIEVKPVLTDRDLLESVLSEDQVAEVEDMACTLADHALATDVFATAMIAHVKAIWPKGTKDWPTWKAVRGVIYANHGEYGARCLRNAYDAADIGERPTASGNKNNNSNKGISGAKWVGGIETIAETLLERIAKMPKRELEPQHVKAFVELAKSLMLRVKAARKDLAA